MNLSEPTHVHIIGQPGCIFCEKAVKLAEDYKLKYLYVDITKFPEAKQYLKDKGYKTVPQIWHAGKHIGGYTEFASYVEATIGGYGQDKI